MTHQQIADRLATMNREIADALEKLRADHEVERQRLQVTCASLGHVFKRRPGVAGRKCTVCGVIEP